MVVHLQAPAGSASNEGGDARRRLHDLEEAAAGSQVTPPSPQVLAFLLSQGNQKMRQGDAVGAIADFDRVISQRPGGFLAYWYRGGVNHALGDYVKAIADYDVAIRLQPEFVPSYNDRGAAK